MYARPNQTCDIHICDLEYFLNFIDIPPCHGLRPSRIFSKFYSHSSVPLSQTLYNNVCQCVSESNFSSYHNVLHGFSSHYAAKEHCLFLIAVYNGLLSLVFTRQLLLVTLGCSGYSQHPSQKPYYWSPLLPRAFTGTHFRMVWPGGRGH